MEKEESKDTSSVISKGDSIAPAHSASSSGQRGNREFHTISCLQNKHVLSDKVSSNLIEIAPVPVKPLSNTISGEKGKKGSSSILSYLDSIQSIINNPEYTPPLEKAQSLIENSWLSILMEQLNDEKKLINKYSHRFSNILLEVNITLNSLQENNVIKRKFPFLYKYLDSRDFIFITYSLCLSYSNKIGYTAVSATLTELVGNNILYRLFKKSDCSTLTEFKIKMQDSNLISYKLGDFLFLY
jgi:hypothetical protein